jgi:L-asparaginase II
LLASHGDPQTVSYLRSSSKPLQVLPFVEMGGVEKFGLTERELSVLCASHSGTDDHYNVVTGIQKKIGACEDQLLCGVHWPMDSETSHAMLLRGDQPTPNRHNCSGKHTGFLAHALLRGLPTEDYINPDHPIQKTILQTFAEMCSYPVEKVVVGVDGCSAPVFALPLQAAAFGIARLSDPKDLAPVRADSCRKITHAMSTHPDMVGGPKRFDTDLMRVMQGKVVAKGGAEGYQVVGILAGAMGKDSPGIGMAMKISDGDDNDRARALVTMEILQWMDLVSPEQLGQLASYAVHPIRNWRRLEVGELRPCFTL